MKFDQEKLFAFALYLFAAFAPFSISGAQGALGLLLLIWIGTAIRNRNIAYRFSPVDPLIGAFVIWTIFAALFAVDPAMSLSKSRRLWIFLGYFALARAMTDNRRVLRALMILSISAAVTGLYAICQYKWGNAVPRPFAPPVDLFQKTGGYNHAVGLFDHHLTYGNMILMAALTALGLAAMHFPGRKAVGYAIAGAFSFAGLVFSFARSAWVGFAAGVAVFGYQLGKRVLVPLIAFFVILVALGAALSPSLRFRLERTVSIEHNLERVAIWETTIHMMQDHPWFGIGMGQYRELAPTYRWGYNIHWTAKSHAHNSYLQAGVESGFPALVLLIAWIFVLLFTTSRNAALVRDRPMRRLLYALVAVHAGFAASCVFQHNLGDAEVAMTWLFLMAATFALPQNSEKDGRPPDGKGKS